MLRLRQTSFLEIRKDSRSIVTIISGRFLRLASLHRSCLAFSLSPACIAPRSSHTLYALHRSTLSWLCSSGEALTMARTIETSDAGLTRMFNSLDVHGNGYLDEFQMRGALCDAGCGPLRGPRINEMMEAADANGDGVIDLPEFKAIFRAMGIMLGKPVDDQMAPRSPQFAAPDATPGRNGGSPTAMVLSRQMTRPIGGSAPPLPPVPPPEPGQLRKACNTCGHRWCATAQCSTVTSTPRLASSLGLSALSTSDARSPRSTAHRLSSPASRSCPPPADSLVLPSCYHRAPSCLQGGQVRQA